jgi:hypothetical protein
MIGMPARLQFVTAVRATAIGREVQRCTLATVEPSSFHRV